MSNTYTQIHIQFVFAVKFRKAQLLPSFKDELLKYITAVIQNDGHKRGVDSISKLISDLSENKYARTRSTRFLWL